MVLEAAYQDTATKAKVSYSAIGPIPQLINYTLLYVCLKVNGCHEK